MKNILSIILSMLCFEALSQQYFTFGPSFTYSRSEWFFQASPTNTDNNRLPVGWIKGVQSSPGVSLWSLFQMNTDTVRFGKFSGLGNSILGINSIGAIYRANTYSFIDTNFISTRNWSNLNFQSKFNGLSTQYVRGNGTLGIFPTDNTAFTNGAGYITQPYDPIEGEGINITGSYPNQTISVDTSESSSGSSAIMYMGKASVAISNLQSGINAKQATLVSGTNIKTIEGQSILGSGNIDLTKSDIGLSNVDNTSDVNKPISNPTQTALNTKQGSITLTNTGTSGNATLIGNTLNIPNYSTSNVGIDSRSGYGTGTAYSLTGVSSKITMGTTSPTVTLPSSGTYVIISNLKLDYAGLTTLGVSTSNFKLRRVNNTAGDVPNATTSFTTPVVTLLTGPAGDVDMQGTIYTTSTTGDIIEMWGNRGGSISVGNINVSEAWIVAIRIY